MFYKNDEIILVECPRDAIQGMKAFISTDKKIAYINLLINSGLFDWIDFGSFVSPKAIPQMADTAEVLKKLNLENTQTKLLSIVVNEKGAENASEYEAVKYLGYPFSISEIFQIKNTNVGISESFERLKNITEIANASQKEMVVYISMAFGNPYGETWNYDLVLDWIEKIKQLGIREFSLADTTSEASLDDIKSLFEKCIKQFPELRIGAHFHSTKTESLNKIKVAYEAGCRKFDGAILGFGGCPFAEDEMVGNIPSEDLLDFFENKTDISYLKTAFQKLIS
ncbi:hydroxymethylglutaryl-CoA lyase [Lacihabitans sp. LS3-19]|uniref:hydroxymethylglutaryl-CoA lyase n=1 Tax=Lacihabitans sp. LS3-19 TaxID=2487335 RepID=UPI0020CD9438|nr:hydroxymethylglutaryl-CoA lyase [Lacihabitans sp. LS3-19]MCP9767199.1 hydroxymethylglutaryl-CoA lyase [Lacihabitans sp. LS3-19]